MAQILHSALGILILAQPAVGLASTSTSASAPVAKLASVSTPPIELELNHIETKCIRAGLKLKLKLELKLELLLPSLLAARETWLRSPPAGSTRVDIRVSGNQRRAEKQIRATFKEQPPTMHHI